MDEATTSPPASGLDDDIDLVLRHVSRRLPEALARGLVPKARSLDVEGWLDTQLTARQRRLDRALAVRIDGERRLLHLEWQRRWDASLPFRVFEYHVLLALASRQGGPEGITVPPVESTVVLLTGRDALWPLDHAFSTSPRGAPFSGVRFQVDAVYQRTVAELVARGPLWSIFAPLAVDADAARMRAVLEAQQKATLPGDFPEVAAATVALAQADDRQRNLGHAILSFLGRDIVMQNAIYKMGVQEGLEKGSEAGFLVLAHQVERRLSRPLVENERSLLRARFRDAGPERLADAVLDLAPDALLAWLTAPAPGPLRASSNTRLSCLSSFTADNDLRQRPCW